MNHMVIAAYMIQKKKRIILAKIIINIIVINFSFRVIFINSLRTIIK